MEERTRCRANYVTTKNNNNNKNKKKTAKDSSDEDNDNDNDHCWSRVSRETKTKMNDDEVFLATEVTDLLNVAVYVHLNR